MRIRSRSLKHRSLAAAALLSFVSMSRGQDQNTPAKQPPPLRTTVDVNATLSTETPASITELNHEQLQQIPGIELDDRLRQVPGFSLFRRSSSLVANPT